MILGRRELSIGLLISGAVISVYLVLLAPPTRAQVPEPGDIVVDFSVNVVQGECGAGECPDGARPVTFEPEFSVDRDASRDDLDDNEIAEINEILENQAEVEVTVQVPGPDETLGADEAVCLEPGQYEFTAEVVNEAALAAAIDQAIDGAEFMEEDLVIEEFEDTFVVEECPDDNNGDTIDIDDRDQTNVCNNVVNIILEDVQNPDVDVDNDQAVSGPVSGDVSNEQAVSGDVSGGVSADASNEQVVEVSNEQVVEVAQELNISPVIVQQCIQQNAGRDAIIVADDNDNNDNDNNNGSGGTGGNEDPDNLTPAEKPSNVLNEITTKDLPNTGGFSFVTRGTALMVVFGVALLVLRLVAARRESR
ncbi:MAG: hypothetical protein AVDCRST_MAG37-2445 [uncultured Rubrobacteraceae bacterium]|uniref:Uncharacterized protein n=1 Tax=uncultured Rubrobacteraceae bacterium TaxID=349277 RepID=A0A6J4R0H3_9ACTN|nr:MAG: hypothetical protein AVDCRST_MAG37-2445 [uncultured Rubrobacteraceae bacterium]